MAKFLKIYGNKKLSKWHKISSRGKFVRQRRKTELQNDDLKKMYLIE